MIYRSEKGREEIRAWCETALASWDEVHDRRIIDSPAGPTHVVVTGDGPPLLLLAGTNFCAATWLDLVGALSATHTVHAIDLPGQPGLSGADRPRTKEHYAPWLRAVAERLVGSAQAAIVAHSLGAVVALRAAAQGVLFSRIVLVDPAGILRLRVAPDNLLPTIPWMRRPDARSAAGLLRMMMAPGAEPPAELVAWMALVGRHVRTSLAPPPLPRRELAEIDAGVHIVTGRHDTFLPHAKLAHAAGRRLPAAEVDVVDKAGHLLPHECPNAVVDALTQ